ncbi:Lsr2 family DNA-binding protein [Kocuria marina]|nr:histone-like nucleoid-structuring protein Lsr2 [Kocuria marina]
MRPASIRAWAKRCGYQVSSRDRIHQHIKDAYRVTTVSVAIQP